MNRRSFLQSACCVAIGAPTRTKGKDFDVRSYGAVGDGTALDTAAIQRTIQVAAASGSGARVLLGGGKRYLTGALTLRSGIDFHLADDAQLVASTNPDDYSRDHGAILNADQVTDLKISGTGHIDGQAMKFMTTYSQKDERWEPKHFHPRMFSLRGCRDVEISEISFGHAPQWGLHLLGCEHVLVDRVRISNLMDIPNCDGIDVDHSRHVEIRNCDIVGADDSIVIKTSAEGMKYGPTANIVVKDCRTTTRDSGLKIGTETFGDIYNVRFERCKVVSGGRGPTITHRQAGEIHDIEFSDIEVVAEHHAARWWGWGEAISVTAWPRTPGGKVGRLYNVRIRNVTGRSENSVRVDGAQDNPIENVTLEGIDMTIDRWTKYPGAMFDNRPIGPDRVGLEPHGTPAYFVRNVRGVTFKDCAAHWGENRQDYFSYALEAESIKDLEMTRFTGEAAHPDRDPWVIVR